MKKEENDWEFVSSDSEAGEDPSLQDSENKIVHESFPHLLHTSISTPNFVDEESFVLDYTSSVDAQSTFTDDIVLLSQKVTTATASTLKKVPSFKDIILANAQQQEILEVERQSQMKLHEEKFRKEVVSRPKRKPRLVVNTIKRCSKSTGDLRSLVSIQEDTDTDFKGSGSTIQEEDVLGETDAMEYYYRKKSGVLNHKNGLKLRPDEAKRKEMIIHKRNAQRLK